MSAALVALSSEYADHAQRQATLRIGRRMRRSVQKSNRLAAAVLPIVRQRVS